MGSQRNIAFIALLLAAALLGGVLVGFVTWRQRAAEEASRAPVTVLTPPPAPAEVELAEAEALHEPVPEPVVERTEPEPEPARFEPEREPVVQSSPPPRVVLRVGGALRVFNHPIGDGLRIEVGLREAPLKVTLRTQVRADADRYAAELSLPWPLANATLFARIDEPGFQRRIAFAELPAIRADGTLPEVYFDPLYVASGSTVQVRVTDPIGEVAPQAEVRALYGRGLGDPSGMYPVSTTQDLGQGLFLVHVPRRHPLFMEAELAGVGRTVRELAPEDHDRDAPLELVLVGTGELSGHLLDTSGEGIASLTVTAEPLERVESLERGAGWVDLHSAEDGGLLEGSAISDPEGRFRIDGLQPGDYVLGVKRDNRETLDVGRAVHSTGETGIVLRLALRRIELTVTMEDGSPVENSWPGPGRPFCMLDGAPIPPLGGARQIGWGPVQSFPAEPGREYVVGWVSGAFVLERSVLFPVNGQVERVELRLPLQPRLGRARIVVRDADGGALEVLHQIEVSSLASGQSLYRQLASESVTEIELHPGRYALKVEGRGVTSEVIPGAVTLNGGRPVDSTVRLVGADATLAAQLQTLEVEAGRTTEVEVALRVGGLVRLLIEADVEPVKRPEGGPDRLLQGRATWVSPGVRVPLQFLDPRSPQGVPRPFLPATLRSTSTSRLPAGRQTLEVSLPGFETRTVEVDVVAGEAVDVTVKLERL